MFNADCYFTQKPTATRHITILFHFMGNGGRRELSNNINYFEYLLLAEDSILTSGDSFVTIANAFSCLANFAKFFAVE
jgi:hypothetical protein